MVRGTHLTTAIFTGAVVLAMYTLLSAAIDEVDGFRSSQACLHRHCQFGGCGGRRGGGVRVIIFPALLGLS